MGYVVASNFGPVRYGKLTPYLLAVTYSAYFLLGVNQYVVKRVSTGQLTVESGISRMLFYFFLSIPVTLVFLRFLFYNDFKEWLFVVIILNILRSIGIALARVTDSMSKLSISNFLSSLVFVLLALFYIDSIQRYIISWALASCTALVVLLVGVSLKGSYFSEVLSFSKQFKNLPESLAFVWTGLITTHYLTAERFILIRGEVSDETLGFYQFADQISLVIYIGLSSLVFFYTPRIYAYFKGHNNMSGREISIIFMLILFAPIAAYGFAFLLQLILRLFLPEYVASYVPLFQTLLAKIYLVILVTLSTIMFAKGLQRFYISVSTILIGMVYCASLFIDSYSFVIYTNLTSLLILASLVLIKLYKT